MNAREAVISVRFEEAGAGAAGGMMAEYEAAAGLLAQLKEMAPHPLWPRQAPTLASPRPATATVLAVLVRVILRSAASPLPVNGELGTPR